MAKAVIKKKEKASSVKTDFKYGVDDVAKELGIKSASARIRLRQASTKKAGKSYGWNSRSDFEGVVKSLKPKKKD